MLWGSLARFLPCSFHFAGSLFSNTAVGPHTAQEGPPSSGGFHFALSFSSPAGYPGGRGGKFLRALWTCTLQGQVWGGAARGSRTHLAAAVPPRCRNPGRPRPSGGSPPASQPGTGGSAQHPGGALPCGAWGGQEGGLIRGHGVRHGERTLCCGPFWTWGSHTRSSPRPHVSKPDPEAPATHPSGFGRVREDFAGPEPAWAFSNRRAAISSEQKDAHCSCRAPRSWRRSLSW